MRLRRFAIAAAVVAFAGPGMASPNPGKVQTFSKVYGPYDLKPGGLMQMPTEELLTLDEPIWVIGYRTEIIDPQGRRLPDNLHCHTSFRTNFDDEWMAWSMAKRKPDGVPFKGMYSDGHTTELDFPDGFGLFFDEGESLWLNPMFNNRDPVELDAAMRISWEYISAADVQQPLRPLYSWIQSVVYPHLYMVQPGRDVKRIDFRLPYEGRIQFMAVHVHPYGRTVELFNVTKGESVWKSVGSVKEDGQLQSMPTYRSEEGYPFTPDEAYRLEVTYENPTGTEQDAMGGIWVFFSTSDDRMPRPDMTGIPKPSAPAAPGHGHGHGD
jgi:hypothetical protein